MTKETDSEKRRENFRRIIQKIADGNAKEGIEEFYDLYGRLMYITAKSYGKTDEIADEVVNDVLFKIWYKADKIKGVDNPEGFIYRMTVNSTRDRLRKNKRTEPLYEIASVDRNIERVESDLAYESMTKFLGRKERVVVAMRIKNEYSFWYIAEIMNSSVSTVSAIYYRAINKIKKRLKNKK